MCAARLCAEGKDSRGVCQCQSVKAERDLDGDQQGPDALEGFQRRAEHEDHDWLHESACAWTAEESFPDPRQPAGASFEGGEEMACGKRVVSIMTM
jgi:hypothetical protein